MDRSGVIAEISKILISRRNALIKEADQDLDLLRELCEQKNSDDMVNINSIQHDVSSELNEMIICEFRKIEYALNRLRSDKFGICEDCEQNISIARLYALPHATRCIMCQRKKELEEMASIERST